MMRLSAHRVSAAHRPPATGSRMHAAAAGNARQCFLLFACFCTASRKLESQLDCSNFDLKSVCASASELSDTQKGCAAQTARAYEDPLGAPDLIQASASCARCRSGLCRWSKSRVFE